ncbi:unnamed protein product [Caretta caretta]
MIDFIVVSLDLRPYVLDTQVKRGAEQAIDHHLVKNFSCITGEVLEIECKWTLFRVSIVEAARKSYGLKVVGACQSGNPRTCWWTPVVREDVKSKKPFQAMLANRISDMDERYRLAKKASAVAVIEAKAQAWEEFGETMENDYQMASKMFWQTIHHLRKGRRDIAQVVLSKGGEMLTLTEEIVERWKEHFGDILNPIDPPPFQEAALETSGEIGSISDAEVNMAMKCLHSGKVSGVNEIRPEMLKALDCWGAVVNMPLQCCVEDG